MKMKRNLALALLGVAAGAIVILTQTAWSDRHHQPFKLEGTWIATLQEASSPAWMYNFAPSDPSGREASFHAAMIPPSDPTIGGFFPDTEYAGGYVGEAVVTGPNQAAFTIPNYGMKKVGGVPQLVYIVVDSGIIKRVAAGKTEVTHNLAIYLPAQDANGDGLPDEGQAPVACVPNIVSFDTRLPILQSCQP